MIKPSRVISLLPLLIALHVSIANAQAINLTGLWQDDSGGGAVYRVRHVGNQLFWIVDGTSKGSYVNIAFGEITGQTMTGKWVDLPGSPTLGGGDISLRIESNNRFVKISSSAPYGAQAWTRQGSTTDEGIPPARGGRYLSVGLNGQSAVVEWSNAPTSTGSWVSIVPVGTSNGAHVGRWAYTQSKSSGRYENGPLAPGAYEARFYADGGYGQLVDRVPFEVGAQFQRVLGERQPENTLDIAGTWTYGTEWVYVITQNDAKFTWSLARNNQKAEGTITGKSVSASWSGPTSSGSATGTIIVDAKGKAVRIEWSNGIVFTRN